MTIDAQTAMKFAEGVYADKENKVPAGYISLPVNGAVQEIPGTSPWYVQDGNGFCAAVYKNPENNQIVISYRGTDDFMDYDDDIKIFYDILPSQYNNAWNVYLDTIAFCIENGIENPEITIVGHSLGGALAQLVAAKISSLSQNNIQTYTFNAPGVLNLLGSIDAILGSGFYDSITNYCVMNDWCGMLGTHVGKTLYLPPIAIESDPFVDTHCKIFDMDCSEAHPEYPWFFEAQGLALWCYDVNTNYENMSAAQQTIYNKLLTKTNENALVKAIDILRQHPADISKLMQFHTTDKGYFLGTDNADNIVGNEFNDYIYAGAGNDTIYGGMNIDTVYGGDGDDKIYGGADDDYLVGDAGEDIIYGGDNDDYLNGGAGFNILYGDRGNDSLRGGDDGNKLYGGSGNDQILGGKGDDELFGGDGNDRLNGYKGNNILYGGSGYDTYVVTWEALSNIIIDSDAQGEILYDTVKMTGGTRYMPNNWEAGTGASHFRYQLVGNDLIAGGDVIIKNFCQGDLGIYLYDTDGSLDSTVPYRTASGIDLNNYDHDNEGNLLTQSNTMFAANMDINKLVQDMNAFSAGCDIQVVSTYNAQNNTDLIQLAGVNA